MADEEIPAEGHWPVDPQTDQAILKDRIWVDGCFDFTHHGHAGALLQAKRLGTTLYVGIHSDESIAHNKGPTVMTLPERVLAVSCCRWANVPIPHAPYVTSLPWVSHYGCHYVVHGDDITTDSTGQDSYRFVKDAGRFLVVKRTPGISTTDLVGRMLLFSRGHFLGDLRKVMAEGVGLAGGEEERVKEGAEMTQRMKEYARDESGKKAWVEVFSVGQREGQVERLIDGVKPWSRQRVVYVDGSFDLFSSGHIEFLKQVVATEEGLAREQGWFEDDKTKERIAEAGCDHAPAYVVVGLHDDKTVNEEKGSNYPIMNLYERALCTLQCKYIHAMILSAPWRPSKAYLTSLPYGAPAALYHGPTTILDESIDPYAAAKEMGIYARIREHEYSDVNAAQIVQRILQNRAVYEERQRKKGWKAEAEKVLERRERDDGDLLRK